MIYFLASSSIKRKLILKPQDKRHEKENMSRSVSISIFLDFLVWKSLMGAGHGMLQSADKHIHFHKLKLRRRWVFSSDSRTWNLRDISIERSLLRNCSETLFPNEWQQCIWCYNKMLTQRMFELFHRWWQIKNIEISSQMSKRNREELDMIHVTFPIKRITYLR